MPFWSRARAKALRWSFANGLPVIQDLQDKRRWGTAFVAVELLQSLQHHFEAFRHLLRRFAATVRASLRDALEEVGHVAAAGLEPVRRAQGFHRRCVRLIHQVFERLAGRCGEARKRIRLHARSIGDRL